MTRAWILAGLSGLCLGGIASAADVISTRTLRVGTVLTAGDVTARTDAAAAQLDEIVGREVRKTIYAGHPVIAQDLGPPTYVHRNDVVVMSFRTKFLGLRTLGRALGRGGEGEVIDVMNIDTRLTVRALVTAPGHVEILR